MKTNSTTATRQQILRQFVEDVRQRLSEDPTAGGQLIYDHISRQLDLVASTRYSCWFQENGNRAGFDQDVTLAGIAGSDVTKMCLASATARGHFGSTEERVRALAERGDLRYGRDFESYTGLENLYMHAEAGRHFTQTELTRRGTEVLDPVEAEQVAYEVAESLVGHDSFNAGFGQTKLKALLAGKHGGPVADFDYAIARSPSGFLVQVLDRLDACDPETLVRYVTEGVAQRNESITQAIKTGLVDNAAYLAETRDRLLQDARVVLSVEQVRILLDFPGMQDLDRGVQHLPQILALLGTPPEPKEDGYYRLVGDGNPVLLDSLASFETHFLPRVQML